MSMPDEPSGGGGNVFTRKIGPLPMWGWMGIMLAVALGFHLLEKNKTASSTGTQQTAATNNTPGGVDSSLVPQFINQNYENSTPPVAPNVTVNNTVPIPSSLNVNVGQQPVASGSGGTTALAGLEGKSGGWNVQSIGGQNFGLWGSDGKYSLATVAKSHGTTPQQIIAATTNYGGNNAAFQKYVSAGNYNTILPLGVAVAIPITGSGAANP